MQGGRPIEKGHVQSNLFHGPLGGLVAFERSLDTQKIAGIFEAGPQGSPTIRRPHLEKSMVDYTIFRREIRHRPTNPRQLFPEVYEVILAGISAAVSAITLPCDPSAISRTLQLPSRRATRYRTRKVR